jgi:serine/threonine protein kinase/tetratricopeptide (TPR) repeat protein
VTHSPKELLRALHSLLDHALDLDLAAREAWLVQLRTEQPALAAEVEVLLATEAELDAQGFLAARHETAGLAGRPLGAYTLERPLGRGGMGSVWFARRSDGRYEGTAAVKLLNLALLDPIGIARFRREGTALARLGHPNIARLLDAGITDGGQPYLVLEYVDGTRIDRYCEARQLGPSERIALFLQVLDAVAHAHANLLVHRDIKPSNILVTADGKVKLLDFGIAKILEGEAAGADSSTLTEVGGRALTPEYAAPEQVSGGTITQSIDVYALAVLLYVLLSGRHPTGQGSRTPAEYLKGILDSEPPCLSTVIDAGERGYSGEELQRIHAGDLDNILAKALTKRPEERYATVAALADDLRRYLNHEPVSARPPQRSLTWRRWAVIPLLAGAAIGIALGAPAVASILHPSLIAKGQLARRDRIIVTEFQNHTPDSLLSGAITTALRIDLAQSPLIAVMSPSAVQRARQRIAGSNQRTPLTESTAHEVALREGIKAVLEGDISRLGPGWVISVELVRAGSDEALAVVRETARDSSDLLPAVDRVAQSLRRRIGESLRAVRADPPLVQFTTASLEALRHYAASLDALNREGDRPKARLLSEEAVALDSGFAMAWRALAVLYLALGPQTAMVDAASRAFRHRDRLTERERLRVTADYHNLVTQDYDQALAAFRTLLARYPDDPATLGSAAFVYFRLRQFAEAAQHYRLALQVDSSLSPLHVGLIETELNRGEYAAAREALARFRTLFPDNHFAEWEEWYLAVAQGDYTAAERHARLLLKESPDDADHRGEATRTLANLALLRGRAAEASDLRRSAMQVYEHNGDVQLSLGEVFTEAAAAIHLRNRPDQARLILERALRRHPLDSLSPADRPYVPLGVLYAELGDVRRASAMQADLERYGLTRGRFAEASWRRLRGAILLAKHRYLEAQAELRRAAERDECSVCALPALARSYDLAENGDSAAAIYERYLTTPWMKRLENDAVERGSILMRLGELYGGRGDRRRAQAMYGQVADLWRSGDAEFQLVATRARERSRNLETEAD